MVRCFVLGLVTGCIVTTRSVQQPPPPPPPQPVPLAPVVEPPPPQVADPTAIVGLALGENHTCTLSAGGQIRCWGFNKRGMLGIGSQSDPGDGVVEGIDGHVRAIAAGGYQTCAITGGGAVWCWGGNHVGQVGTGQSEGVVPKPARIAVTGAHSLHLGNKTSCALTDDRKLYCWGENSQHQIDDSGNRAVASPTHVAEFDGAELAAVGEYHVCVAAGGRVRCRGELAPLDTQLTALTRVTALSAGWGHTCALQDGKAYCWGKSYFGVLGAGDQCGKNGDCTSVLRPPAEVPGVAGATQIAGSGYHTCVRDGAGAVTCWGSNQGHAFADELPAEPYQRPHALGIEADVVLVGGVHTCTLRAGTVKCRGNDWAGAVRGAR